MPPPDVEEVSIPTPLGPITAKSLHLNTLATVAGLILTACIGVAIWFLNGQLEAHRMDAKEMSINFVSAVREQTVATKELAVANREQNCLLQFKQEERPAQADQCRRNAR